MERTTPATWNQQLAVGHLRTVKHASDQGAHTLGGNSPKKIEGIVTTRSTTYSVNDPTS